MKRYYACRFCIALRGLKASDIDQLPEHPEEINRHAKVEHGYPDRGALQILGDSPAAQLAAQFIDELGPAIAVRRLEDMIPSEKSSS